MGRLPATASGRPASPDSFPGRALSPPPSEWASSEAAAPRPAPIPPGRRNPESPCPGGWGTPLGTALGAPSARPLSSRAGCELTSAPRCPGKRRAQPQLSSVRCLRPRLRGDAET